MSSLFLHPSDPLWRPAVRGAVLNLLSELEFVRDPKTGDAVQHYLAGNRFLQLLMFLGCSPQVALEPDHRENGPPACTIRLICHDMPLFLVATPPVARCARCRTPASLQPDMDPQALYRCGRCAVAAPLVDLDWRQGAGYGCFFVEVAGIHPQEAVPSDGLLQALGGLSQCEWRYFFADLRRSAGALLAC
jgi:hypothetical protein